MCMIITSYHASGNCKFIHYVNIVIYNFTDTFFVMALDTHAERYIYSKRFKPKKRESNCM